VDKPQNVVGYDNESPNSALEIITYMSTIRGTNVQFDKMYRYDQQFRLIMANNPGPLLTAFHGSQ
jgi:hypothetical protein